nr:unnamed protein product [Digitaria exilis]
MAQLELDSFYNKPAPNSSSLTSRAELGCWLGWEWAGSNQWIADPIRPMKSTLKGPWVRPHRSVTPSPHGVAAIEPVEHGWMHVHVLWLSSPSPYQSHPLPPPFLIVSSSHGFLLFAARRRPRGDCGCSYISPQRITPPPLEPPPLWCRIDPSPIRT